MNTFLKIANEFELKLSDLRSDGYWVIPNKRRIDLVKFLPKLDFKVGVEIGTMRGGFSKVILDNNPQMKLYCVDPYRAYNDYTDFTDQKQIDGFEEYAKRNLSGYNCEFIKKTSMEAVGDFKDESLDFVYIDANHEYSYVIEDVTEWTKKVKSGGIIAGHDFREVKNPRLVTDVKEALDTFNILPVFIVGRRMSKNRDFELSWFFIKL